jgi:hypothetical protein
MTTANTDIHVLGANALSDTKGDEKDLAVHLEKSDTEIQISDDKWNLVQSDAIAAETAEKELGVMDSLRMYPNAVAWSVGISLCIIMEGMDLGRESRL